MEAPETDLLLLPIPSPAKMVNHTLGGVKGIRANIKDLKGCRSGRFYYVLIPFNCKASTKPLWVVVHDAGLP